MLLSRAYYSCSLLFHQSWGLARAAAATTGQNFVNNIEMAIEVGNDG